MQKAYTTWVVLGLLSAIAHGQDPAPAGRTRDADQPPAQTPAETTQTETLSEAERIARLQRAISEGEKQIGEVINRLSGPDSEYVKAQAAFQELDSKYEEAKKGVENIAAKGDQELAQAAHQDLQTLETQRQLAKERFELAIQERKALQEQFIAIEQKLKGDQEALDRLTRAETPTTVGTSPDAVSAPSASAQQPPSTTIPAATQQAAPPPAPSGITLPNGVLIPQAQPGAHPETAAQPPQPEASKEVKQAQQDVAAKEVAAKQAEEEARSIEDRIAKLTDSIAAERKLLGVARKQADNAAKTKNTLNEELQNRWAKNATWADLKDLRDQIAEQDQLHETARTETSVRIDRLDSLQSHLNDLQGERIAAMQEAERKLADAERARTTLADLQNPFTLDNLVAWLSAHGPKILGIIVGMIVLVLMAKILESRLVPIMARHGRGAASIEDRENRAKTLMSVFHNTVRIVVIIGGLLMLLAEVGLNIVPLITAAGIAGLAIAFGAQNLIRDYFYGFTILLENQYMVNDVVRIAGISGMVERITLRVTVLRDLEGIVHFVPHGEIKTVSNLTHGWSRALFEIGVAYKEDPDRVMKVLIDLGKELRRDPDFSSLILDDPEMLGVDKLGDSAVVVKFLIKTRPLKQWLVKREMLRRIKNKFDELGIEIPFPSSTVYHRYVDENGEEGGPPPPRLGKAAYAKSYADGE